MIRVRRVLFEVVNMVFSFVQVSGSLRRMFGFGPTSNLDDMSGRKRILADQREVTDAFQFLVIINTSGAFAETDFRPEIEADLDAALRWLAYERPPEAPSIDWDRLFESGPGRRPQFGRRCAGAAASRGTGTKGAMRRAGWGRSLAPRVGGAVGGGFRANVLRSIEMLKSQGMSNRASPVGRQREGHPQADRTSPGCRQRAARAGWGHPAVRVFKICPSPAQQAAAGGPAAWRNCWGSVATPSI